MVYEPAYSQYIITADRRDVQEILPRVRTLAGTVFTYCPKEGENEYLELLVSTIFQGISIKLCVTFGDEGETQFDPDEIREFIAGMDTSPELRIFVGDSLDFGQIVAIPSEYHDAYESLTPSDLFSVRHFVPWEMLKYTPYCEIDRDVSAFMGDASETVSSDAPLGNRTPLLNDAHREKINDIIRKNMLSHNR